MATQKILPQSAALPYREKKSGLQFLLVTSLDTQRWVLPKGHLEPGMNAHQSAAREAFEEAGLRGDVSRQSIGTYLYVKTEKKGGGRRRVEVFPMTVEQVHEDWPEKHLRVRKWMDHEDAISAVDEKKLKKLLARFAEAWAA